MSLVIRPLGLPFVSCGPLQGGTTVDDCVSAFGAAFCFAAAFAAAFPCTAAFAAAFVGCAAVGVAFGGGN